MFHPVSLFVGLRYLRGRSGDRFSRFVSTISTIGITIGVMSLVTVLSVMNGFEGQLKAKILGVLPQAVVSSADGKTVYSETVPNFIQTLPQVEKVTPIVRSEAVIQSTSQLSVGMVVGIEPAINQSDEVDPIASYIISGSLSSLQPKQYGVLLGHSLARHLNVGLGDKVRLMITSASQYTPLGRIPSQRNFTVVGMFNTGSDVDSQLMVTHRDDIARLMKYRGEQISGWRLFFNDPFAVSDIANNDIPDGWRWSDWREQRGELFQAVGMEKNMMGLMLGLIIGVAAFNIISALIMVVMEKQSEVAILKTQGMTPKQILTIFIVQGASSGVIGALIGGSLGVLLANNLNSILETAGVPLYSLGGHLPVIIDLFQVSVVIILAIVLSLLATLFPSYRAAAVNPAEALRYE